MFSLGFSTNTIEEATNCSRYDFVKILSWKTLVMCRLLNW